MGPQNLAFVGVICCTLSAPLLAQKITITIPRRSELTPVQRLNREGVDAVIKHRFADAEDRFYKAYLYDPTDPFTLNNLGYVSEVAGDADRAEKFYALAAQQDCGAVIDRSSDKDFKNKPMMDALGDLKSTAMRVNRVNIMGMKLLSQQRPFEAKQLFEAALSMDEQNAFTLNNLAVAEEATGNFERAINLYDRATLTRTVAPVVVTLNKVTRGRPISAVAAESAQRLRRRVDAMTPTQIRANMLTIHGVLAVNSNDWTTARRDFLDAYSLDPQSAFTLNNLAYLYERDGDPEMAKAFYAQALQADDAGSRVGLATQASARGQQLAAVADVSHHSVDIELSSISQQYRGQPRPFVLKSRHPSESQPVPQTAEPAPDTGAPVPSSEQTGTDIPTGSNFVSGIPLSH